jgi:phosphatidylserine/phosphatidylglycerophosphate/cardiolipin synthase-like enzyme
MDSVRSDLPKTMIDSLEAAGVMVMKFRPKTSPWTLRRRRLRRLHRKIVVVDRSDAFVGGINIIDNMDIHGQTSTRFDYAVSVQGPLVKEIHDSARRVWSRVAWTRCVLAGARKMTVYAFNQTHRADAGGFSGAQQHPPPPRY